MRENGPPIRMTWRARSRQVGPRVLEELAARIGRGDLGTEVDGADFERFGP